MRFLFILFLFLFLFGGFNASSQDLSTNPLAVRLIKTWKLVRVQTRDGMQTQPSMVEFRLVLSNGGNLMQGLYPEGMFESTWHCDGLKSTVRMTDVQSAATYVLRVLQLTNDRLVLEAIENGERTIMHYEPMR